MLIPAPRIFVIGGIVVACSVVIAAALFFLGFLGMRVSVEHSPSPAPGHEQTLSLTIQTFKNGIAASQFQAGEPIEVGVYLQNHSASTFTLLTPGDQNAFEKVFYFQMLNDDDSVRFTDTRDIVGVVTESLPPQKITLEPGETHQFTAYLNSADTGIAHRHFGNNFLRVIAEEVWNGPVPVAFAAGPYNPGIYHLRGIYDTTGYEEMFPEVAEAKVESNVVTIDVLTENGETQAFVPIICDDPGREYIAKNTGECMRTKFHCAPERTPFRDACGCGCYRVDTVFIDQARAIEIAQAAIQTSVKYGADEPIEVALLGDKYVVTFVNTLPPGTRGADYHAKVTIDAQTGEVLEILVGS